MNSTGLDADEIKARKKDHPFGQVQKDYMEGADEVANEVVDQMAYPGAEPWATEVADPVSDSGE